MSKRFGNKKASGTPFVAGNTFGKPKWNGSTKAPNLFGSAAAAAPQVGAYASSARRPTSSSSTSYQHTHKAPRLLSPVAQPVVASVMSANGRGLEATLVTIAAATASSLPPTPFTPSTTSMSDTTMTPSSSTLGRASSSEILFAHHTATAPLTATNTARLSRHSDVPPNSGTRSSGSEHTALPRQTECMLPGSYASAHAQAMLLDDTVRLYSITETACTKQETSTTHRGSHRWQNAPSTDTRPNAAASQPT